MQIVRFALVAILSLCSPLYAQPIADAYVFRKELPRVALVIGNASYKAQDPLPLSLNDATEMTKTLDDLGFAVTSKADIRTRAEFVELVLLPFIDGIEPDSVVVLYFSGHGLSYGGENYLLPLDFPTPIAPSAITKTLVSVTSIRELIAERRPALAIILFDACRDVPQGIFVDDEKSGKDKHHRKGLSEESVSTSDTLIWFASEAGKVALAPKQGQATSYFTRALLDHLPIEDRDIDRVRKHVRVDVMKATGDKQIPWVNESSNAEVWLRPGAKVLAELEQTWRAALEENKRAKAEEFLLFYGSSPFAAAARKWLADHPLDPPATPGQVPPSEAEASWATPFSPEAASRTPPLALDGPLASARVFDWKTAALTGKLASVDPGRDVSSWDIETITKALAFQKNIVTREDVRASVDPDAAAGGILLGAGTVLKVEHGVADKPGWLRVTRQDDNRSLFIALDSRTKYRSADIGQPLMEVRAKPIEDGPLAAVDDAALRLALFVLRNQGWKVSWVSIASPATRDENKARLYSLRTSYAARLLRNSGVPADLITVSEGVSSVGNDVRLRIYGRR